jgi:hypothetical protein
MVDDLQPTRCAQHPQVETYLRCGQCLTPICPRCLIQTPVGARCRNCARLSRLPVYDVPPRFLLRGAAAGLVTAALGGIVLSVLPGFGWFFQLVLGGLLGVVVAGAVSRATNYKRGASLGWTTVAAIVIGFFIGRAALILILTGGTVPLARLLSGLLLELIMLAVAALVAYNRLR